jgi:hypothetical protein
MAASISPPAERPISSTISSRSGRSPYAYRSGKSSPIRIRSAIRWAVSRARACASSGESPEPCQVENGIRLPAGVTASPACLAQ